MNITERIGILKSMMEEVSKEIEITEDEFEIRLLSGAYSSIKGSRDSLEAYLNYINFKKKGKR